MLLVTGTPQFSGHDTHDILAYANIFAARSGLDQYFNFIPEVEYSALIEGVQSSEGFSTSLTAAPRGTSGSPAGIGDKRHTPRRPSGFYKALEVLPTALPAR